MTTNKAQKHAIRVRMGKTGESYTAARRQVLRPEPPALRQAELQAPEQAEPLPPRQAEPEVSEAAIRNATGRGWDDWFRLLDERGLEGFSHRETARWLNTAHAIDGWWAQSVTVGYERARGLRARHQRPDGFEVSVSKTIRVVPEAIWEAVADTIRRSTWIVDLELDERALRPPRTARFEVPTDGSRVLVSIDPKAEGKSAITITHSRLSDADAVETQRQFWRQRLAVLAEHFGSDAPDASGR
jgi:hypothetical protein